MGRNLAGIDQKSCGNGRLGRILELKYDNKGRKDIYRAL